MYIQVNTYYARFAFYLQFFSDNILYQKPHRLGHRHLQIEDLTQAFSGSGSIHLKSAAIF